jgi:undecaprenyl diphosphate synthase
MVAKSALPARVQHTPRHVAVIMDGNGRWARQRTLPRITGHRAGIKPVRATIERCAEYGIETLTLFAFSSENWRRPVDEVRGLMGLFLDALKREVDELDANGVRIRFIGDRQKLSPVLEAATSEAEARTAGNRGMELVVAVAYGGRWDLVQAARRLAAAAVEGRLEPEAIDEAMLASAMTTAGLPDVDLLIRTGGERRVSNFLLWNVAYSELYFSEVLWPDFDSGELDRALDFYAHRQRRFGRTAEQVEASNC